MKKLCLLTLLIVIVNFDASSQIKEKNFKIEDVIKFEAIPSDPVFDMLGLTDGKMEKPGTVKKLLANVVTATDIRGKMITGLAICFSPYQIAKGEDIYLDEYVKSKWERIKTNFQISLGTAPSINADSSLNWGIGVRIQLFNSGDGRLDSNNLTYLKERAEKIFSEVDIDNPVAFKNKIDELNKEEEVIKNQLEDDKSNPTWNAGSLDINAGFVFVATDSKVHKSGFDKFRLWANGGYGKGVWQILGQAGLFYKNDRLGQNDSMNYSIALMTRFGNENFRIGLGGSLSDAKNNKGAFAIAGEMNISESAWLVFAIERKFEGSVYSWNPTAGIKSNLGNFIF